MNELGRGRFRLLAIASFIIHYLGGQTNRFLDYLSEMATIRSSGLPLLNAPNGIPGPWRVSRYLCGETFHKLTSGSE
jgi:hypothetical protein